MVRRRSLSRWGMILGTVIAAAPFAVSGAQHLPAERQDFATEAIVKQQAQAATPLDTRVTVTLQDVSLKTALDALMEQSGVKIAYSPNVVPLTRKVSVQGTRIRIEDALIQVLLGTRLSVQQTKAGHILIADGAEASSKQATGIIAGKVINSKTKQPVIGARVSIGEQGTPVLTANDGTFRIQADVGEQRLTVRGVGFMRHEQKVTVVDGKTVNVEVVLEASASQLDEVVVTGTVAETEIREIPNAITVITAKDLEERGVTRIDQLFRGDVPGLFVTNTGTSTKEGSLYKRGAVTMYSRGASLLDGVSPPIKTYIDGVEVADPDYINMIDPESIERIEIVSGAQASAIYGSGALGGVMQIFTKKGTMGSRKPDVNLALRYSFLENDFSNKLTPKHDYSGNVTDAAGSYSYNVGGGYRYEGQWTPGRNSETWDGFGGLQRSSGAINASLSARWSSNKMGAGGGASQENIAAYEQGLAIGREVDMIPQFKSTYSINTYSLGFNGNFRVLPNWSHSVTVGVDRTLSGFLMKGTRYISPLDTTENEYRNGEENRQTLSYSTAFSQGISGWGSLHLTLGANLSKNVSFARNGQGPDLENISTGRNGFVNQTRSKSHTAGYFGQMRFGVLNQLYLTLGLRAEMSPAYGEENKVHYTPSNGLAYTMEYGEITAKARVSYGRATRAPQLNAKDSILGCEENGISYCNSYWKRYFDESFLRQLPAPGLLPETQSGPEFGVDFYWGNRGSFSLTHYNQHVKDLISRPLINVVISDSLQYGTIPIRENQYQYQNLGDIKNQGWTGNGTLNVGPVVLSGTYSWTKSRITKLNPLYTGDKYLGGSPAGMAEHTGRLGVQYSTAATSVLLNLNWIGQIIQERDINGMSYVSNLPRDFIEQLHALNVTNYFYERLLPSKTEVSLNASRRVSQRINLVMNISNLTNRYDNEGTLGQSGYPTLGRQTTLGARIRLY